MKKILFIILALGFSDAFSQIPPIFSDESTCFRYKAQALKEYENGGFTFDIVDSSVTSRDLYIDSVAKSEYNLTIERYKTLPYEVCGTATLEMDCYFDTRDSIYGEIIGSDYLDRLIENLGFEYDVLYEKNIDTVYHNYPDSSISFENELMNETITALSRSISNILFLTIKIKSNIKLELEGFSYNVEPTSFTEGEIQDIKTILKNFESKLMIKESALHNGKKVNSNYKLILFVRPKK